MKTEIRTATIVDAFLIETLNTDVQEFHAQGDPDMFKTLMIDAESVRQFEEDITDPSHFFFVAELDAEPVGYIFVELRRRIESSRHTKLDMIYVNHLSVKPDRRRNGVGRALLDAAKQFGKRHGISRMALDVWSFKEDAQLFFIG